MVNMKIDKSLPHDTCDFLVIFCGHMLSFVMDLKICIVMSADKYILHSMYTVHKFFPFFSSP